MALPGDCPGPSARKKIYQHRASMPVNVHTLWFHMVAIKIDVFTPIRFAIGPLVGHMFIQTDSAKDGQM